MKRNNIIRIIINSFASILLIVLIIGLPYKSFAGETYNTNEIKNIEQKIAKGYSSKFCNAIGMGLSKESSMRLAINENTSSRFNPSLWIDLALGKENNINQVSEDELDNTIITNIVDTCGYPLGLSNDEDIKQFKNYFLNVKNGIKKNKS